jgi:benzoyl-CoA reductase/2-hydroxyglutaryl-CoA dehydratase subunit BcrC/BadD/HgdB
MNATPKKISLESWNQRHAELIAAGLHESWYGGPLQRHVQEEGDRRLLHLQFDNSPAALRLWNFLLTENQRLHQARSHGEKIVGTMKDLGTVPVMVYALPGLRAFYPDGAWWTPCLMECSDNLLQQAEALGIGATFCPVRAMLPAMIGGGHFPRPDLLICSTGAVCDDFNAIAQRMEHLGCHIHWWEVPRRRSPDPEEPACDLPGGLKAPALLVECVREELEQVRHQLSELAGKPLTDKLLAASIRRANEVRRILAALRQEVYTRARAPLPALEMLIAEMLAIHFCSDQAESLDVLAELLQEARRRTASQQYILPLEAIRTYWVNPVADLRAMNLLEECGGRVCGSDYMFTHALDLIPENLPPMEALARSALADSMVGPASDRAVRVIQECKDNRAEALIISRIPGASHCAWEGNIIRDMAVKNLEIPVLEMEIPAVCDAMSPSLRTRLQAIIETAQSRRTLYASPNAGVGRSRFDFGQKAPFKKTEAP